MSSVIHDHTNVALSLLAIAGHLCWECRSGRAPGEKALSRCKGCKRAVYVTPNFDACLELMIPYDGLSQ
jgi:hypothetical protein